MEEIAILIAQFLNNNTAINAVLNGEVYWELAEEEGTLLPFCNFSVEEEPGRTKDIACDYMVTLKILDTTLTQVARVGDVIKKEVNSNTRWQFLGGVCEYVYDDTKLAYRSLKFKIK